MASDQLANKDVARLVESAVKSAERRLSKGVSFAPFAFVLGAGGKGAEIDAPDPRPGKALAHLKAVAGQGLQVRRWRATVVAYLSKLSVPGTREKRDGIGLEVQHLNLPPRVLFVPLEKDKKGRIKPVTRAPAMPKLWEL
jgi:hypothetical protein